MDWFVFRHRYLTASVLKAALSNFDFSSTARTSLAPQTGRASCDPELQAFAASTETSAQAPTPCSLHFSPSNSGSRKQPQQKRRRRKKWRLQRVSKLRTREGAWQGKVGPGLLLVLGHPFRSTPLLFCQARCSQSVAYPHAGSIFVSAGLARAVLG